MLRRTLATEAAYEDALKTEARDTFDMKPALKEFKYWRIIENEYPYDNIASVHHMLVPTRQIADLLQLTDAEMTEFLLIKRTSTSEYDVMWENTPAQRSVLDWYHLHLIKLH